MTIDPHIDRSLKAPKICRQIPLADVDNAVLLDGLALWQRLKGERPYPPRSEVSARVLKSLLRNTMLLKVIDGGRDYEYRIVGDAFVLAHGATFQGKSWSEAKSLVPGHCSTFKPVYDEAVRLALPAATRGWIERGSGSTGHVYCEYLCLPLGETEVDHLLVFAVYIRRDGLGRVAGSISGSFDNS